MSGWVDKLTWVRYLVTSGILKAAPPSQPQIPEEELSPELESTLDHLQHAVLWIRRATVPFFDEDESWNQAHLEALQQETRSFQAHWTLRDDLYPLGHTVQAEITAYHQLLEQACLLALGGSSPSAQDQTLERRLADQIRSVLLPP